MDSEKLKEIIPPILRGILYNSFPKNRFFVTVKPLDEKNSESELKILYSNISHINDVKKISSLLKVYISTYIEEYHKFPNYIVIPNITSFCITKTPCVKNNCTGLQNKIIFITGGSTGIGAEITRSLIEAGAFVYIGYKNNYRNAQEQVGKFRKEFGIACANIIKIDVTSEKSVIAATQNILKKSGGLDVLISNAGIIKPNAVTAYTLKDFTKIMNVNYIGYFLLVKHFTPILKFQNISYNNYFTDIIQINSRAGIDCSPKNSAYGGSKFGGIGLTRSFACELIQDNIKVNAICPGNYYDGSLWSDPETGLLVKFLQIGKVLDAQTTEDVRRHYENKTPIKRGVLPADISKAIIYAIEQNYETGQAIPVTGGQVMLH